MSPDDLRFMAGSYVVKTTQFSGAAGSVQQVLQNDPNRWGAVFCNGSTAAAIVSTLSNVSGTNGVSISDVNSTFFINVRDHASLPMVEWFALIPDLAAMIVIEICLA